MVISVNHTQDDIDIIFDMHLIFPLIFTGVGRLDNRQAPS